MNVRRRPTTVMITPNARIPLGPSDVHAMKVIAETGQNVKVRGSLLQMICIHGHPFGDLGICLVQ